MQIPVVPYEKILTAAMASGEDVARFLREELSYFWREQYGLMEARPSEIINFTYGNFDYIFDTYQQEEPYDPSSGKIPIEARLVAAIGKSSSNQTKRDDGRLKGLTLSAMPGPESQWDRGHYIAHSIGGTVDGNEANVFLQLRSINRGRYRKFENYCRNNPGVICFSRPIYVDTSAHPFQVEFGVVMINGEFWVETLPNRPPFH
jgi:hypothetical protein